MAENFGQNNLEVEIAELSERIEEKKRALESQNGIVREKELIGSAVAEHFYPAQSSVSAATASDAPSDETKTDQDDYLSALPPETVETINAYISQVPNGIRATIAKVSAESPFILDAFHDALVTRLYEELKERGIVK